MQNLLKQEFIAPLSAFLQGKDTSVQNADVEVLVTTLVPIFQELIDSY